MRLFRLSDNSFVRIYDNGELGYIVNQLTMFDRTYNETGADFLQQLSREPQDIYSAIENLQQIYQDADYNELKNDFTEFLVDLARNKFIVIGETGDELDALDERFTYNIELPKTRANKFTQEYQDEISIDTQEFLSRHDMERPRLVSLHIELTTRCNERCIHCYIPNKTKNNGYDMSLERFMHLIDEFYELGGIHVILSGGESLLHKDIISALRYCRQKDMKISVLSNFLNIDDELISVFKEVNLSMAKVSLYSMDASIHDAITKVKGSFVKTIDNIRKLHAADIPMEISCPLLKTNFKGYKDVMAFAYELKIKANTDLNLMAESDFNTENLDLNISLDEQEEVLRDILETDENYATMVGNDVYNSIGETDFADRSICGAGKSSLSVSSNGNVAVCAGWGGDPIANVFIQPLKVIWENNEKLAEYRHLTFHSFSQCVGCKARDYCGICLSQNFNESGGDVYAIPKRVCDTAFMNMRVAEEFRKKWLTAHT